MATIATAMAAIEAFLQAGWTQTPVAFANDNSFQVPVNGSGVPQPWLMIEIDSFSSGIKGSGKPGAHLVIDEGEIEMTVFVARGTGREKARELATAAGEVFRTKVFARDDATGSYIRTWSPQVDRGEEAISANPQGNWWAVTCRVPFEFYRLT